MVEHWFLDPWAHQLKETHEEESECLLLLPMKDWVMGTVLLKTSGKSVNICELVALRRWTVGFARWGDLWEKGSKSREPHSHPRFLLGDSFQIPTCTEPWVSLIWEGRAWRSQQLESWRKRTQEEGAGKLCRGIPSDLCLNSDMSMCGQNSMKLNSSWAYRGLEIINIPISLREETPWDTETWAKSSEGHSLGSEDSLSDWVSDLREQWPH